MKKKKQTKILLWLLVAVLCVAGIYLYLTRANRINYTEETARTRDLNTYYTFSGNMQPSEVKIVVATNRGKVQEWLFEEGDTVEEDETVMTTTGGARVKSTMSGTISDIYIDEDTSYNIGDALFRVADYAHPKIMIQVDEYDISALKKGMAVSIKVQATGEKLTGKIDRITREATVVNDVAYYTAEISVDTQSMQTMGLTCEISIPRDSVDNAITLSVKAIQYGDDGKPFVYIYDRHNEVVEQNVILGVTDGAIVEIKDGVRSGETILLPPDGMEELMRQMMTRRRNR